MGVRLLSKRVGTRGFEPPTSSSRTRRSKSLLSCDLQVQAITWVVATRALTPTVTTTLPTTDTKGCAVAEKKRGNGEGSKPRKRPDGRWEARYTDEDGKRKSVYAPTRKEVAKKLREAIARIDDVPAFEPSDITVKELFEQYEEAVKDTMKRRSFETCQDIARLHLLPTLGSLKLKNLGREHVQRLYSRKRDQGLSAASVRRIHDVLRSSLNHAVRWRLIHHNVCTDVSQPRRSLPEIRPFSKEEAKRFLAAAEVDRYHALYVLGLTSGARWGELNGLFWSDLDLERRVVSR